jgi:tetratricopeptide (TPR) repeat protein/CHAT domain-containing protein
MLPREPGVENGPAAAPYGCLNRAAESVAHVREAIMTGRGLLRASALIVVLLLSFGLNAADAKPKRGDELQTLNQNVDKLFQAAKYPEAAEAARRALAVAERRYKPNDRRVLDALTQVVQIYRAQGRFAEAEPLAQRALVIAEKTLGREDPDVGTALDNLGTVYVNNKRYADAEPLLKRALAIREKSFGPLDPRTGVPLSGLALLYTAQSRFADVVPINERLVQIFEKQFGPEHPGVALALNNLATAYQNRNRLSEAESLFKRALAIREKALDPNDALIGTSLNNLAMLYVIEARFPEAEPLYQRSLALQEKALGKDHPEVAAVLDNFARFYLQQQRFAEAEPLLQRALAIREKGSDQLALANSINSLGQLYLNQGRYPEAEQTFKRCLTIREKLLGPDHTLVAVALNGIAAASMFGGHFEEVEGLLKRSLAIEERTLDPNDPDLATTLYNLATLYHNQSRFDEAEPLYQRTLAIKEKSLGPDHIEVGKVLNGLGLLYVYENRYAEAEPLLKRGLAIFEKTLGPDNNYVATTLSNLAVAYVNLNRFAEAEPYYQRALAIKEKALGPDNTEVGTALNNLAYLYDAQNRFAEAEPLYQRTLAIKEKALGPDHPEVGTILNNLAFLYVRQNRFSEAEPVYQRALAIKEKALGPDHPDVSTALSNIAGLHFAQRDWAGAAAFWHRSTDILIRRTQRGTDNIGRNLTSRRQGEAQLSSNDFFDLIKVTHRLASEAGDANAQLGAQMFQTAQWATASEAARSLSQMAARAAKDDPGLGELIRERQDLVGEWQTRDQWRTASFSQPPDKRNLQAEAENAKRLQAIDARIAQIDKRLAVDFPDYAALASPSPSSIADVQAALGANEALVMFVDTAEDPPTPEETFIWAVTKSGVRWVRADIGKPSLIREVSALRCGLDYDGAWVGSRCTDLLKVGYSRVDHALGKPLPFDLARAHGLYKALFGPIEDLIKDKQLLIVPSGALAQLPFQVLVTEPPNAAIPETFAAYRDVAWFARKNAVTILPAVSSLRALRSFARESHADKPFIGFGDPLLDGDPTKFKDDAITAKLARDARCPGKIAQQLASLSERGQRTRSGVRSQGNLADLADLRSWTPLPETADELCDVAQNLGADPAVDIYLGARATETEIKRLSESGALTKYKVVHFATHGAIAGELSGAAEPGLILTPPEKASEADDGYLTASEIAALKLDAQWVILSACNTAAAGWEGAEALSGLARAFFYAGARSVLVSHWSVASETTVKLVTHAISELKSDPKLGRTEALRRAMLSLSTTGKAYEAHPAFWAPFVLVGEGATAR